MDQLHSRTDPTQPQPTWYEELLAELASDEAALDAAVDALIDAGLRHALTWTQVTAALDQLPLEGPPCPWCGGDLGRHGRSSRRCRSCGRIHNDEPELSRPNRARAEEINRAARESWERVAARIAARAKESAA